MIRPKGPNSIPVVSNRGINRQLPYLKRKSESVSADVDCRLQRLGPGGGPPYDELPFPALQAQGPKQPGQAQIMISVKVSDEDLADRESHPETHHLPLRAFSAVEQIKIPLSLNRESGDISPNGRPRGRGPQKRDT
jgi:hypothetical protein